MLSLKSYLICRIIFNIILVITATYIWSINRNKIIYHDVSNNIKSNIVEFSNLKKINDNDSKNIDAYKIQIENQNIDSSLYRVFIVSDIVSNNLDNNYIKYQINDGVIKSLNMDGIVLVDELNKFETKSIDLKIWISDTYDGELNYNGRVIVS